MSVARRLMMALVVVLPQIQGVPAFAQAQDNARSHPPRIYNTQRLVGEPPSVDGRLDDEAWKEGEWAGEYIQQNPVEGGTRRGRPN